MSERIKQEETLTESVEDSATLRDEQIEQVSAGLERSPKRELIAHELTHAVQQDSGQVALGTAMLTTGESLSVDSVERKS